MFMHKNVLMLAVSFRGSYTKDEPNFPQQNNVIFLKKMVSRIDKVVNFKDFSRPSKEIKYFSRTLTKLKDFSTRLPYLNSRPFQDCTNHEMLYQLS